MKGYNYTSTPLWAVRPLHSFSSCTGVHFILLCALGTFRCTFTQFSVGKKTNPTDIKCETEGAKTLWYELYHTLWSNKRVGKGVFFFPFFKFRAANQNQRKLLSQDGRRLPFITYRKSCTRFSIRFPPFHVVRRMQPLANPKQNELCLPWGISAARN